MNWKYDDKILCVSQGAGFQSVDMLSGSYKAFCDFGVVPGNAMASSGSALFTSLFYSKGIDWIYGIMDTKCPSDFIGVNAYHVAKSMFGKSNRVFDNIKIRKLLEDNMTGEAFSRVKVSVTRMDDWSSHMKMATPAFTLAATSIPLIFMPVKIGDSIYGDGGIINNIPTPSISEVQNWKHIFVFIAPPCRFEESNAGIQGILNLINAMANRELDQLVESGFANLSNVTIIQSKEDFGGGLFKWSDGFQLRDFYYNKTMEILKELNL
jgi:hypothetical protein